MHTHSHSMPYAALAASHIVTLAVHHLGIDTAALNLAVELAVAVAYCRLARGR